MRSAGTYRIRGAQRGVVRRAPRGMGALNCSVLPFGGTGLVDTACWCLSLGSVVNPFTGKTLCDTIAGQGTYAAAMALNSPETAYPTNIPAPPPPAGPSTIQQETVYGAWTPSAAIAGTDWGAYQQAVQDFFGQVGTGVLPPTPPTALNPISIAAIGIGALALVVMLTSGRGKR